jgi:hypothetical protein
MRSVIKIKRRVKNVEKCEEYVPKSGKKYGENVYKALRPISVMFDNKIEPDIGILQHHIHTGSHQPVFAKSRRLDP